MTTRKRYPPPPPPPPTSTGERWDGFRRAPLSDSLPVTAGTNRPTALHPVHRPPCPSTHAAGLVDPRVRLVKSCWFAPIYQPTSHSSCLDLGLCACMPSLQVAPLVLRWGQIHAYAYTGQIFRAGMRAAITRAVQKRQSSQARRACVPCLYHLDMAMFVLAHTRYELRQSLSSRRTEMSPAVGSDDLDR